MSTLRRFSESLEQVESPNPKASFNVKVSKLKGLKKLGGIKEEEVEVSKPVEIKKETSNFPQIIFPKYNSLILPIPIEIPKVSNYKTAMNVKAPVVKFKIDTERQVLEIGEGAGLEEFPLEMLTAGNSRGGKSISKSDAQRLASYFKLNIPPQNKKDIFIKAILKEIGL